MTDNSKHQPLVPKLRFFGFKEEWKSKKLSHFKHLESGDGDWLLSKDFSNEGEYQMIQLGNIGLGKYIDGKLKNITQDKFDELNGTTIQSGDLLINRMVDDSIYTCIFNKKGKYITSVDVCWIRKNEYFSNDFFMYLMNTFNSQKDLLRLSSGSGRVRISKSNLFQQFSFNLPSLNEQHKIASFLTSVDNWIENLEKQKTSLEEYKKSIMQKIFSQEIRFKDDDESDFPDWNKKKLKDVFDRVKRKNKINNQNILTISARDGLINQEEYFNRSVSASDVTGYYLLHRDEFAYNKSYSNGYPMGAIKKLNMYDKGVLSTLYICFRLTDKSLSVDFYEQYFEAGRINRGINKIAQEGARAHGLLNMSISDFFDIQIDVPSRKEQEKIASFLSSIDDLIKSKSNQIKKAKEWKKGLLQQMFV